ncbi:MAG: hypothetical protein M1828_003340 [Chrysothrix sp. TS-e1954]|nr:MAG: hypothetical protein M1828_003340 [Chrysothrix sp. TS-e1954]
MTLWTAAFIGLLAASFCSAFPGNPIQFFDDYIECFGDVPTEAAGWPQGRDPWDYRDNMDLCAASGRHDYNMGCQCTGPGGITQCLVDNGGDSVLLNARVRSRAVVDGMISFHDWCKIHCICKKEEEAEELDDETDAQRGISADDPITDPPDQTGDLVTPPLPIGLNLNTSAAIANFRAFRGHLNDSLSELNAPYGGVCNATSSCNLNTDCQVPDDSSALSKDCRCQIWGSQLDPATHAVRYWARCGLTFHLPHKRDEEVPCPCNGTYVSHACCDSRDGLVWEAPELKLGELVEELHEL